MLYFQGNDRLQVWGEWDTSPIFLIIKYYFCKILKHFLKCLLQKIKD